MPTILALRIGKVKTARTEWQDGLPSVSWLLHVPSTCFRMGSKLRCILPSQMSMASARTEVIECLASTGVNTLALARPNPAVSGARRSEEHTSELQSLRHLVCRLL